LLFATWTAISLSSILLPPRWQYVVFSAGILFDMVGLEGWNLAYES
jgi:hypothetical protein